MDVLTTDKLFEEKKSRNIEEWHIFDVFNPTVYLATKFNPSFLPGYLNDT